MGSHHKYVVCNCHQGEDDARHSQSQLAFSLAFAAGLSVANSALVVSLCRVLSCSAPDSLRHPSPVAIPADAASFIPCGGIPMGIPIAFSSLTHTIFQLSNNPGRNA